MTGIDIDNAAIYYELYMLDYLLRNKYISREEHDRIVRGCGAERQIFFVSKLINLGFSVDVSEPFG